MCKIYQKKTPSTKSPAKGKFGGLASASSKPGGSNLRPFSLGGFTLIELLVVVLIIGILAAIAVPKYQVTVGRAYAAEALEVLYAVSEAERLYVIESGELAGDIEVLPVQFPVSSYYNYSIIKYDFDGHIDITAGAKKNTPTLRFIQSRRGNPSIYCFAHTDINVKICTLLGATNCQKGQLCSLPYRK